MATNNTKRTIYSCILCVLTVSTQTQNLTLEQSPGPHTTYTTVEHRTETLNTTLENEQHTQTSPRVSYQPQGVIAPTAPELNGTCAEGPEVGSEPANDTCSCGPRGYFYGNFCESVNLTAADDINTSRRVLEIQWAEDPDFSRMYAFLYREFNSNGDPQDTPRTQAVEVQPGDGFFCTWLTYLEAGGVEYVVCVMESSLAEEIKGDQGDWSRIDAVNDECARIQTDSTVSRELTMAAIIVGGSMGIILLVVFIMNVCSNSRNRRPKKVEVDADVEEREMVEYRREPEQLPVPGYQTPGDIRVERREEYRPYINDQIEYTPHSYTS